jgi:hypothetical protein
VDTPDGRGTVVDVDLLRQRVKVRMEDSPETVTYFANTDIAILRSGKAKKNDPPIPADLAPISGSGKRVRKEPEQEKLMLDPIKFRYSTETVADEQEVSPVVEESVESKPSRRRRNRKPQAEQPEKQAEPKPEKEKAEPKQPQPEPKDKTEGGEEAARKRRRPNHYRRNRKPKQNNEG